VKIIRPNESARNTSGGFVGAPQSRGWLKEWIENKGRWVLLDCGHVEDLNDRAMLIIRTFDGCTVGCEQCNRFASVVKTLQSKTPITETADEPLF
jgi:hypothetical protein